MKVIAILLISLLLSGCCGTFCKQDPCAPLVVQPKAPPADAFIRPVLSLKGISPGDDIGLKLEAYKMTIEELQDHVFYLEKLLIGYR
jgi:hypothetical protein